MENSKNKRHTSITVDPDLLDELNARIERGEIGRNISDAVEYSLRTTLKIHDMLADLQDPARHDAFILKMKKTMEKDRMWQWLQTATPIEREGIAEALGMIK